MTVVNMTVSRELYIVACCDPFSPSYRRGGSATYIDFYCSIVLWVVTL